MRSSTGVLAACALCWLVSCGQADGPAASPAGADGPPPVSVEVITVEPSSKEDAVDLVGQLEAEESVEIRPELDGVIETVEFDEGQEVKKAAVLFRLRDAEQRARLAEATANAALAEDVFRRTTELAKKNVTAASQLDRARSELAAARARADLARVEFDRTRVRAPFDGVLGARLVSPGDRVTTDTTLVQIDAVARLRLTFVVPEIALPIAHVGADVSLTTAPFPGERFEGEVFFVSPTLDPATRRLLLKAWVSNADRRLRPGMFANLRLTIGQRENALLIPEEAVVYDRQGTYVWRVDEDGHAARVAVEVGDHVGGRVEIKRGVGSGDVLVSAGTHKVTQGAAVRPVEQKVAEPSPGAARPAPARGGV